MPCSARRPDRDDAARRYASTLTRKDRVKRIAEIGTAPARMVEMLEFFERFDVDKLKAPTAARYTIRRLCLSVEAGAVSGPRCNVEIEVQSELTVSGRRRLVA